jgi:hypothetical protein
MQPSYLGPRMRWLWTSVVARNATGTTEGPDRTFTTLPLPPTVGLEGATATPGSASVTFAVNAQGGETEYAVRYGTGTTYTAQVQGAAGQTRGPVSITAALPELTSGTTYHYSVEVRNDGGEEATPDRTFTTTPQTPSSGPGETPAAELAAPAVVLVLVQPPTPPLIAVPLVPFPPETSTVNSSKPLTPLQKLWKALRTCRMIKHEARRAECERQARRRYPLSRKGPGHTTRP